MAHDPCTMPKRVGTLHDTKIGFFPTFGDAMRGALLRGREPRRFSPGTASTVLCIWVPGNVAKPAYDLVSPKLAKNRKLFQKYYTVVPEVVIDIKVLAMDIHKV